jgi:transposase
MNREAKGLRVHLFEMRRSMDLTNEQWEVLEPLIPEPTRRADGRGRPWRNSRDVLNVILWVLLLGLLARQ